MKSLLSRRNDNQVTAFRSELDDLFGRFFAEPVVSHLPTALRQAAMPAVDIAETEKSWNVSVQLPGMTEKDIQVQLLGKQLVITGERRWEEEKKGKEFHRVESQFGSFHRSVELPDNARLDATAITATYRKGVLEITVPKVEPTPTAQIPVRAS